MSKSVNIALETASTVNASADAASQATPVKPTLAHIVHEAQEGVRKGYNEFLAEARSQGVRKGKAEAKKFLFGKFGKLTPEQMYAFAQGDDSVLLAPTPAVKK